MSAPRGPRQGRQSYGGSQPPRGPLDPGGGAGAGSRAHDGASPAGWLPLPAATIGAVRAAGGIGRCSNLSLALNRMVDVWRAGFTGLDDARRRQFLGACVGIVENSQARTLLGQYLARQDVLVDAYQCDGWQCVRVRGRLTRRLVIGLGIAHPLEVNLALHRIGGFPYLPGSTIKGAVRAAAEELEGVDSALVRRAFGPSSNDQSHAKGALIFLDALPETSCRLAVDVMTPHHSGYYTGSEPPADWQSPIPILFPCVDRDSVFRFAVAVRDQAVESDQILRWLREALRDGLGGKRSAGYGMFEVIG